MAGAGVSRGSSRHGTVVMRPIIFLDIDDVLAISREYTSYRVMATFKSGDLDGWPELWTGLFLAEARANLVALHREFWPQYVISSSWSNYLTREQMQVIFRRTGLDFVADNMHKRWTTPKGTGPSRTDEIENWIAKHGQRRQSMLVLDDHESGMSLRASKLDHKGLVVLCEPWVGFIADKLANAQRLLRAQMAPGAPLMMRLLRPISDAEMAAVVRARTSPGSYEQLTLADAGLEDEVRKIQARARARTLEVIPDALRIDQRNAIYTREMVGQMNIIGKFKCPKCGWVHIGISEADAERSVADFNEYYESLSTQGREPFGGKPASTEGYKRCFRCKSPSETFVPANEADAPLGARLQVVIAPETTTGKIDDD